MVSKYFIAIIPPEPIYSDLEKIKLEISKKYNNKSSLKSPAHLTLHMPFEIKEEKESNLINTISTFSFKKNFTIEFNGFGCFAPKVIFADVVKNKLLAELQKELVYHIKSKLNIFNQYNDLRGFHPHVTLAFRDLKKEFFYLAFKEYQNKNFNSTFSVSSYFLLKHDGKRWNTLKEFSF